MEFNGKNCEKSNKMFLKNIFLESIQCNKEKIYDHYVERDCQSVEPIRSVKCVGNCGAKSLEDGCCAPLRTKRRRVKMHCQDGGTKISFVNIIRKCACKNECNLPITLNFNAHNQISVF